MAAPKRKIITLECTECGERNYSTEKNTSANAERIEINKFCPRCNKRTKHKETKQFVLLKKSKLGGDYV